jgi:hypothetical protein
VRNVNESTQYVRELLQHQSRSTPTLVVGDEVLIGFDPEKVDRAIGFKS